MKGGGQCNIGSYQPLPQSAQLSATRLCAPGHCSIHKVLPMEKVEARMQDSVIGWMTAVAPADARTLLCDLLRPCFRNLVDITRNCA